MKAENKKTIRKDRQKKNEWDDWIKGLSKTLSAPISERKKKEIRQTIRETKRIRKKFSDLRISFTDQTNTIPTDLGDILEVSKKIQLLLKRFLSLKQERNIHRVRLLLEQIHNDLYIHLTFHLRSLKQPLRKLIEEIQEKEQNT